MGEAGKAILTALIAGAAAMAGAIGGPWIQRDANIELARQKFYSDLVLKSLEQKTGKERLEMLTLLTETHLITDSDVRDSIRNFVKQTPAEKVPQSSPLGTAVLPEPMIPNARIFLLAGTPKKAEEFEALRNELGNAKYRVLDARVQNDVKRPDGREVRFFNFEDQIQAEKITEFLNGRNPGLPIAAKRYEDASARPGYIEIWLGR